MALKIWGAGSNAGADYDWNNPLNWDGDTLPADYDSILLDETVTANPIVGSPIPSVFIENITVDSPLGNVGMGMNGPNEAGVKVYGTISSNSPNVCTLHGILMGLQSFSGMWEINSSWCNFSGPVDDSHTIAQTDPTFIMDYLGSYINFNFTNTNPIQSFKYGEFSGGSVINKTAFTSLNYNSSNPMSGVSILWNFSATINAITINFSNIITCQIPVGNISMSTPLEFSDTTEMNIVQCGTGFFQPQGFGSPSNESRLYFPLSCTINCDVQGTLNGGIGMGVPVLCSGGFFSAPSSSAILTINLNNSTSISITNYLGTIPLLQTGVFGSPSASGSFVINAYDTSTIVGAYYNGQCIGWMGGGSTINGGLYGSMNLYNQSIYVGIIIAYYSTTGDGPIKFYDQSNLSPLGMGVASWPPEFYPPFGTPAGIMTRTTTIPFYKSSF